MNLLRLPILVSRARLADLARRLAALEERHFLDQQSIIAAEERNDHLREQVETLRSLYAANQRDAHRIRHERDQALAEVSRLFAEDQKHRQAMRSWIERSTQPHICQN